MRKLIFTISVLPLFLALGRPVYAQKQISSPEPTATVSATPTLTPLADLTQKSEGTIEPLKELIDKQNLGPIFPANPIKYAIRNAVASGIPVNLIVLLLLLPIIATIIAAARHLIGLRGFGIFLPAALSVVFIATGPLIGIALFLLIISVSMGTRIIFRLLRIKLQYLPRAALVLWAVSLAVLALLFLTPIIKIPGIENVSIFPVLILALLAEDFTRVQLGKSFKTALSLTSETIILALISYVFLTLREVREFALLNPEILLLSVALIDYLLGKYVGLRVLEVWRFKKLIKL